MSKKTMELTDEQQSEIDEMKWRSEESLAEDIDLRRDEFKETVVNLREELKDDIKELRKDSKEELKDAIRDHKASWK